MGRDFADDLGDVDGNGFNPRARVGRDTAVAVVLVVVVCFNPRARVGRDLELRKRHVEDKRGFNPRARVGRDRD